MTKKPPKIFTAAKTTAKNPKIFENEILPNPEELKEAIIAPTIITDEIALVTDIKGVCNDGVTLQTTKYPIKIERIKILSLNIKGSISMIFYYLISVFEIISSSKLILKSFFSLL